MKGLADRDLLCPCGGVLAPWGHARPRRVRGIREVVRPRRGRCSRCAVTHVLLPPSLLARRADCVGRVAVALERAAGGAGFRSIAAVMGVPEGTVRGWLRRARANVTRFASVVAGLVRRWDPGDPSAVAPPGDRVAVLVSAVGDLASAAVRRWGAGARVRPWELAGVVTGGWLLGPFSRAGSNTSWPLM